LWDFQVFKLFEFRSVIEAFLYGIPANGKVLQVLLCSSTFVIRDFVVQDYREESRQP